MVQRHGVGAFKTVESKLEKMKRDGVELGHFRHWCWITRAVLEITRLEQGDTDAVH
jgi:hypothetical protein